MGTIGTDTSANGVDNYVILEPDTFLSCAVTFNPTTVNSSAAMVLTVTPTNTIPVDGQIVIELPNNKWTNDISTNFVLPITSAMSCT